MVEEWRFIPGVGDRYEVSNLGRVRSHYGRGRILKDRSVSETRHRIVHLRPNRKQSIYRLVHRLVAAAFIGPVPEGKQVNHIDGNPENNCSDNLEYVTQSENNLHAWRLGLFPPRNGENSPVSILTVAQVMDIKYLLTLGLRAKEIGSRFGVSKSCVNGIRIGARWPDVPIGPSTPDLCGAYRGPCAVRTERRADGDSAGT